MATWLPRIGCFEMGVPSGLGVRGLGFRFYGDIWGLSRLAFATGRFRDFQENDFWKALLNLSKEF